LKQSCISTLIFIHVDLSKTLCWEIDTLAFALQSVLSQYGEDMHLHPIVFCSSKFSVVEIDYKIYNKELLAIIHAFEKWCHLLEEALHTIMV